MSDEYYDKRLNDSAGYDIKELGELFIEIKNELCAAQRHKTILQEQFDRIRLQIIPDKMDEMGIDSVKIKGVGRLGLTADAYTGIEPDHKIAAYQWLRDNGFEDTIKPTINGSTLKALLKEQMRSGEVIPDDLFKFTPFMRASVTKTS